MAGSLPQDAIERFKNELTFKRKSLQQARSNTICKKSNEKYFEAYEAILDQCSSGPKWLHDDGITKIVEEAIQFRNGKYYDLECFCIMPNHVHMMVTLSPNINTLLRRLSESPYILTRIIGELKKDTALVANRILGRTGQFWQHESYDHVIRNEREFNRMDWYILNNPVKAGLVKEWTDWKWSFAKYESRNVSPGLVIS